MNVLIVAVVGEQIWANGEKPPTGEQSVASEDSSLHMGNTELFPALGGKSKATGMYSSSPQEQGCLSQSLQYQPPVHEQP
jgi:hypothetical protein